MPYLQDYYADSFKQEAVAATMDRMTRWRDETVAALLAADEAEYVGSSDDMDDSGSEDAATDAGQHGEPMAVDVEEEELYDDVPDELKW